MTEGYISLDVTINIETIVDLPMDPDMAEEELRDLWYQAIRGLTYKIPQLYVHTTAFGEVDIVEVPDA